MNQKNKEVWNIIKEEVMEVVRILNKNLTTILFMILFLESIMFIHFGISKIISESVISISFILSILISFLKDKVSKASKYKYRPKERYTKKNEVGDISIDESKIHQAIIYLSILEDEIW